MGSPKITFVLNFGFKNPPDGEFENSEIVMLKKINFQHTTIKLIHL